MNTTEMIKKEIENWIRPICNKQLNQQSKRCPWQSPGLDRCTGEFHYTFEE